MFVKSNSDVPEDMYILGGETFIGQISLPNVATISHSCRLTELIKSLRSLAGGKTLSI